MALNVCRTDARSQQHIHVSTKAGTVRISSQYIYTQVKVLNVDTKRQAKKMGRHKHKQEDIWHGYQAGVAKVCTVCDL